MDENAVTISDWLRVIRGEFAESPGLCLTKSQVQRWWGLDSASCDAVIQRLVADGFLRRIANGTYRRGSD
jgi:hypothetical protein